MSGLAMWLIARLLPLLSARQINDLRARLADEANARAKRGR